MSVQLTGTGGLFTRIGLIGGLLNTVNSQFSTTVPPKVDTLADQFNASDRDVREGIYEDLRTFQGTGNSYKGELRTLARELVIEMVNDDNRLPERTLSRALIELIRQMNASSDTVQASVVSATVTADAGNNGDAVIVVSTKTKLGETLENAFAEDIVATVTSDSQSGGATEGKESLSLEGELAVTDALAHDWPEGSDGSVSITAVTATDQEQGAAANALSNGDMESFTTTNDPDDWTIRTGSAGTTVFEDGANAHRGNKAVRFDGDGVELTAIDQTFGTDTTIELDPLEQYAVNLWIKCDATPAAGILEVALVDGSGTITNDFEGTANSFTKDLTTVSTTYIAINGTFRTPEVLPATLRLRIRLSTALTSGRQVFMDDICFAKMTQVYTGGPYVTCFSGATKLIKDDSFNIAVSNSAGGFQRLFDRLFGMRGLRLLLPSAVSPGETLADSLIA